MCDHAADVKRLAADSARIRAASEDLAARAAKLSRDVDAAMTREPAPDDPPGDTAADGA